MLVIQFYFLLYLLLSIHFSPIVLPTLEAIEVLRRLELYNNNFNYVVALWHVVYSV